MSRLLLLGASLGGCTPTTTVDVNIHGVNYAGDAFSYTVADPAQPGSAAGGELVSAFGAGGTTCCVTLPTIWRPGIKLEVRTKHWLGWTADRKLPEVKQTHLVDVPQYADGKPGELWVLRGADGNVGVVSSDFQPDHEKWPGRIKGWPVPSLEYRRERWEIYRKYELDGVELYLDLLAALKREPQKKAKEEWEFANKDDPSSLKKYSGPEDPGYIAFLKNDYEQGLVRSKELLKRVMDAKL